MKFENVNELANVLTTRSQIPGQYFEIDDIVLFNESNNEDLIHYHQEYSVYCWHGDKILKKIESITVTMYESDEELAEQLDQFINEEMGFIYDKEMTIEQFEKYKQDFEEFARNY